MVDIFIEQLPTKAFLDTEATVSGVSGTFYRTHLSHFPLHPLEDRALRIQVAGGNLLPHLGYVEAGIKVDKHYVDEELLFQIRNSTRLFLFYSEPTC